MHPLFGEIMSAATVDLDNLRARFVAEGYVVVRGLFSNATLDLITQRTDRAISSSNWDPSSKDAYRRAFRYRMNPRRIDPMLDTFARGPRVAEIALGLLDVEAVRLTHDQILYKPPSAVATPAHADQFHWPVASEATVTAWIPLQDTPKGMGSLEFFSGSHRMDADPRVQLSTAPNDIIDSYLCERFDVDTIEYTAGDVSFHLGWTFHRTQPNGSTSVRRAYSLVFMDADIRLLEPQSGIPIDSLQAWCPGAAAGGRLDDEYNPVVFRRRLAIANDEGLLRPIVHRVTR